MAESNNNSGESEVWHVERAAHVCHPERRAAPNQSTAQSFPLWRAAIFRFSNTHHGGEKIVGRTNAQSGQSEIEFVR